MPIHEEFSFTYDGKPHAPTYNFNNQKDCFVMTGDVLKTDAGAYTVVFSVINSNYTVAAGRTYVTSSWRIIVKGNPELTLPETSVTVKAGKTLTFTVTTPSDGTLSVKSSDTSVATVSIDGKTVTVTGVKVGTTTITVSQA